MAWSEAQILPRLVAHMSLKKRTTGTTWILVIMLAGTVLAAAVSAFAGCRMLRRQFEKAGITK